MAEIVDEPRFRDRIHIFNDRFHAGELLAKKLDEYKRRSDTYVLAIPAGGVQVGFIVSERLNIVLDLVITRKIHVPWNREAGFGAISWDGLVLLNEALVTSLGLTDEDIKRCIVEEKEVIRRRLMMFRGEKPFPNLKRKTAIIIDDGLASGYSMLTTVKSLKRREVGEMVIAIPTAHVSAIELVRPHVDKIVCLNIRSRPFFAVADAYKTWYDLDDGDVLEVLRRTRLG